MVQVRASNNFIADLQENGNSRSSFYSQQNMQLSKYIEEQ